MNTNPSTLAARASLSATMSRHPHERTKLSALRLLSAWCGLAVLLYPLSSALAVTFPGNARVEITDTNGGLSWSNSPGALTIQCWFKLSAPSGFKENMTILMNKRTTTGQYYAYHLWYDYTKKTVEFRTYGRTSPNACQLTVIDKPYQERWYHVAVVRDNAAFTAYVDGRPSASTNVNVGDSSSNQGVIIGGPDATAAGAGYRDLYGEVQEVSIYQAALSKEFIADNLFRDQPTTTPALKGYFKLSHAQNPGDRLRNLGYAPVPAGTELAQATGPGVIAYEEADQAGEQSAFDARRNGGLGAIAPLSGSFAWDQPVLARPTPGIPLELRIGYGSVNASEGFKLGSTDPFAIGPMGNGWRHSFETRVLPAEVFSPKADADVAGVMMWNGAIETWDRIPGSNDFRTRRGEYRGEFFSTLTNCQWVTPERLVYTFRRFDSGDAVMRGRLLSIRDFNNNEVRLEYDEALGTLTNVVDTTGGRYVFNYSGNLLRSVTFQDWQVQFTHDATNRLISKTLTNTSGRYTNINATLRFNYYNAGSSSNLLQSIVDARTNAAVLVVYDEYGRKTNSINALAQTNRVEYGLPDHRQITTTDAEGYKWIETYDRKGRVISRKNPLGHENRSVYDEHGNQVSTTDPLGNLTLFAYDDRSNLIAVTNALGEVSRRTIHDFFNKPLTETDALGRATTNNYDAKGNLLSVRDALGTVASFTYTTNGLVATQTDANGNTNRFAYSTNGFRVAETDAAGFTKRLLPNELGWNFAVTNALGEVTAYAYDLNGNTVRTLDPLGRVYAGTYDPNGNLLTQTDPKGQQARNTYDALNRKTTEGDRGGGTNGFAYTRRSKVAFTTNALGSVTRYQYDAANRETNAADALGNSVSTAYDANGNAIALVDPLEQRWTKVLDRLNRTVAVTDPFGNTSRTLFDPAGRVRATIAPDGSSTAHRYDSRGRMIARTNSLGLVWRYDYDGVGNITNITDALAGHYVMVYSNRNERILERNQDTNEWHYTYDALVRLKTQRQPNGNVETVEYDSGSRILSVSFSTGRVNSFLYDDNDNPVVLSRSGSGPATISQLAYDAMDRVQQYTDAFYKTIHYDYDRAGRLTGLTYPDGKTLTNRYDALDRLTDEVFQFSAQQAFTNTYAYDKTGRLIRRAYPNGIVQTNTFDTAGRLTGLSHAPLSPQPTKLNVALGFAYDRNGNTIQSTAHGTFRWPMPSLRQEQARFTPAAHIIDRTITLTGSTNPQSSVLTYHYDPSGNMTNAVGNGQSWSLTYDEDNRTTSICWTNGALNDVTITNRYDALGRRIARTADGILTGYVLDLASSMERILCDLDAARNITSWYVHGLGLAFKVSPDGSLTCYHADAQGNIIGLTDAQANTVAEYAYTPYGRTLGSTNYSTQVSNPYLFGGGQGVMEELPGLYFMRARYYSAEAGVFLSTDPVRNIGPTWLPLAFVYAEGNPLRFNDPNGEFINFLVAGITAVVGAVVNAAVDVVTQLIENGGDFSDLNWGRVGIAAGIGFIQGGIAGLTMGASIAVQVAVGAVVGGVTSFLQTGFGNLTEGKPFVENWQSALADVGLGALSGGAGPALGGLGKTAKGLKAKPPPLLRLKSFRAEKPPLLKLKSFRGLPKGALDPDAPVSAWDEAGAALREEGGWGLVGETTWGVATGLFGDAIKQFCGWSQSYEWK